MFWIRITIRLFVRVNAMETVKDIELGC